jgi:hypothetical protein
MAQHHPRRSYADQTQRTQHEQAGQDILRYPRHRRRIADYENQMIRGVIAGIVLAVLIMAGWFVTLQAIEREVENRYGTNAIP